MHTAVPPVRYANMVFVVVLLISEFFASHILHHDKIVCLYRSVGSINAQTMPSLVRLLRVTVNHV